MKRERIENEEEGRGREERRENNMLHVGMAVDRSGGGGV